MTKTGCYRIYEILNQGGGRTALAFHPRFVSPALDTEKSRIIALVCRQNTASTFPAPIIA